MQEGSSSDHGSALSKVPTGGMKEEKHKVKEECSTGCSILIPEIVSLVQDRCLADCS